MDKAAKRGTRPTPNHPTRQQRIKFIEGLSPVPFSPQLLQPMPSSFKQRYDTDSVIWTHLLVDQEPLTKRVYETQEFVIDQPVPMRIKAYTEHTIDSGYYWSSTTLNILQFLGIHTNT